MIDRGEPNGPIEWNYLQRERAPMLPQSDVVHADASKSHSK